MRFRRAVCWSCLSLVLFAGPVAAWAGDGVSACGVAPVVAANSKPNIFSPQQEQWLGEAERDELEAGVAMVKDASLSRHLQELVDRMAVFLPEPHVTFHAVLVDSSEVNGWSIAGGNIYITRKLAATVKSDDELAAVLGHEMGHIAAHQFAFEMTAQFKRLLNVTSVGDRADVRAKYQQLIEAAMRDKNPPKVKEDTAQDEADVIGVYLAAAAGFRAGAFPEAFDREFYLEGKTGSKVSDFFGLTKPDQKRLRGMRQMVAALPAGCGVGKPAPGESAAFATWQAKVVANQKGAAAAAAAELATTKLQPPLQMEIKRLRFSPDGKYLLAQDYSSVYVVDAEREVALFRMDAEGAGAARFSPDSTKVTFMTPGLHVESWDIATQTLTAMEPMVKHTCVQSELSPDGRTIFCVTIEGATGLVNLTMVDARSGDVVWEKSAWFRPSNAFLMSVMEEGMSGEVIDVLYSSFSSDGNVVLIGPSDEKMGFDLRTRQPIKIGGGLKNDVTGSYAFVGSDRVAGVNGSSPKDSGIYSFPDGKRLQKLPMYLRDMESVSDAGDQLLVKSRTLFGQDVTPQGKSKTPEKDREKVEARMGVADLATQKFVFGSQSEALDISRGRLATENGEGKIRLAKLGGDPMVNFDTIPLPPSRLGGVQAIDSSPDGRLLAFSTRDRSGIWDLKTGGRVALLKPFSAVHWTGNRVFVAELEKSAKQDRQLIRFDLAGKSNVVDVAVSRDDADYARMWYQSFAEWKRQKGDAEQLLYHSLDDGKVLWTRDFPEGYPRWTQSYGGRDLIFSFPLSTHEAKAVLGEQPELRAQAAALKKKDAARLIEVVDVATGKTEERMVLDLPMDYDGTNGLNRVGDRLYVTGQDNRTLVYSLKTGKQLWQTYGWVRAVDATTGRVCVVNRSDEALVFDAEGKELRHTHSGTPIRYAAFERNGERLMMLGSDQVVSELSLVDAVAAK